ncbi:ORF6N domain-containing protein [Candidatus Peribacteria bacterium]|nr:ORF6N domain-containing protein [Candidatus Peribacteria bacterium]
MIPRSRHHQLIPSERIEKSILYIRGQKVLLDSELAQIYGITTARLNQQVRRNIARFPADFAFVVTEKEFAGLMLQFATSKIGRGGRRKLPFVFTEHGAVMVACILNTPVAVAASILVVRAFVRLRTLLASHIELARKLDALEAKLTKHDEKITSVFEAIRQLMTPEVPEKKGRIGFRLD